MNDLIEKVKQGLKICTDESWVGNCEIDGKHCPYEEDHIISCFAIMCRDALSVIEQMEQEIERLKAHKPDCDHAEHDSGGCLGYGRNEQDDEPIDACKKCEKYTGKDGENDG